MIIGESFCFCIREKTRTVDGVGTIYNIELIPASRQVFITFIYEMDGRREQVKVDLDRFWRIIAQRQATL